MASVRSAWGLAAAGVLVAAIGSPAAAAEHIYSYDAVSPEARALTGAGLTFQFRSSLIGLPKVERLILTGRPGSADVRSASPGALGPGGLDRLIGAEAREHALYEIRPGRDARAFIRAACPGSTRVWLALGPIRYAQDLKMHALGDDPANPGKARLCATYQFRFRGEWKLPGLPIQVPDDTGAPEPQF